MAAAGYADISAERYGESRVTVPKTISLRRAMDLLRIHGNWMMMENNRDGASYWVMTRPAHARGGRLSKEDAYTILKQPNLIAFEDGLFPGNSQCWRLG